MLSRQKRFRKSNVLWLFAVAVLVAGGYAYYSQSCPQLLEKLVLLEESKVYKTRAQTKFDFQKHFDAKVSYLCIQLPYSTTEYVEKVAGVSQPSHGYADEDERIIWIVFKGTTHKPCFVRLPPWSLVMKSPSCVESSNLTIEPYGDASVQFAL